ncbi:MAG: hypothetical protein KO316_08225, partial [Methanobacterium sp.]|nr:hypothetical protein [Methanobacterium sp.]
MATVTLPMVGSSVNSTMDISRTSDTKNAVQTIANAVDLVYANGPGAKRTVNVYIPLTMTLKSIDQVIGMNVTLSENQYKFVNATVNYNVTINNPDYNQGWHTVTIEWPLTNSTTSKSITISH